jgi:hypothetical protein
MQDIELIGKIYIMNPDLNYIQVKKTRHILEEIQLAEKKTRKTPESIILKSMEP